MRFLRVLIICCILTSLSFLSYTLRPTSDCPTQSQGERMSPRGASTFGRHCEDEGLKGGSSDGCLQQAIWGKCNQPFLAGRCNKSCGQCHSLAREKALRSVAIVSARQPSPCATPDGDAWVMRAQQNKAEYARLHRMSLTWTSAIVDAQVHHPPALSTPCRLSCVLADGASLTCQYDGAWNKLAFLARLMNLSLKQQVRGERTEWILWMDWDVVITDLSFTLPVDEYEASVPSG